MEQPAAGGVKTGFTLPFFHLNSICTDIESFQKLCAQAIYTISIDTISDHQSVTISKSAKDLYNKLCEMIKFKKLRIGVFTRTKLAQKINRSERTVSRLLTELEQAGYVLKSRRQNKIVIQVLAPNSIVQDSLNKKPRPPAAQKRIRSAKNGTQYPNHSFKFIINNNNNRAELASETPTLSASYTAPAVVISESEIQASSENTDIVVNQAEIEKLEQRKQDLDKEFTDVCRDIQNDRENREALLKKKNKISEKLSSIYIHIEQRRPRAAWKQYSDPWIDFDFTSRQKNRLLNALAGADNAKKIIMEIGWAVKKGSLRRGLDGRDHGIDKAISIALLLHREGRWQTPIGYRGLH